MNVDEHFSQANDCAEVFRRQERVRSKKAAKWIQDPRMVLDLVQVVLGTEPNESYLHLLLKEHGEDTWSGQAWTSQLANRAAGSASQITCCANYGQILEDANHTGSGSLASD